MRHSEAPRALRGRDNNVEKLLDLMNFITSAANYSAIDADRAIFRFVRRQTTQRPDYYVFAHGALLAVALPEGA